MSNLPAEDDPLLEQQELLGHLLGDAHVLLWLFRVRDALGELLTQQGLAPQALNHVDRLQPRFAVGTWYWLLEAPQAPALAVSLSLAAGNEGFVEFSLGLARKEAVDSPWATLDAHQVCAVSLASAQEVRDWQSPGYAAVRLRVALDKSTVRTGSQALHGSVLSRPVKPWLAPALALLLAYLEP